MTADERDGSVAWWCDAGFCSGGYHYLGPDARRKAVAAARRHWKKHHVATGEVDTDEACMEVGPRVRAGEMTIDWWTGRHERTE